MSNKPLSGLRVLELGQLLAGPFTTSMLGYFGAEVIKIEPPGSGDPIRGWRKLDDSGTSYWWRSISRNKKSVTIDLRAKAGQALVREIASRCDVLVENFRPGVLESWGLAPAVLKEENPGLVVARISGYGQDGPNASKPGFASVCEAFSGFRYVNGFPGEAPVRPNLSIGDTIAALHAVIGILMALRERDQHGEGQVVDVALFEAMFNLMEAVVPEYSGAGEIRQPSGTTVTGIVPTNTYRCADDKYIVIGGNGDSIFRRLMEGIGRNDLAVHPEMATNAGRVKHETDIDAAISAWCAGRSSTTALRVMDEQRVPAGPIYDIADAFADPHYRARKLFEAVEVNGKKLEIPALMPKLQRTPGTTEWAGPALGAHTEEVLGDLLHLTPEKLAALRESGVV